MILRAAVANGQVWGVGSTDQWALQDATSEFMKLAGDPEVDQGAAPTEELTLHDISFEDARRVMVDGDRTWRGGWSRAPWASRVA